MCDRFVGVHNTMYLLPPPNGMQNSLHYFERHPDIRVLCAGIDTRLSAKETTRRLHNIFPEGNTLQKLV